MNIAHVLFSFNNGGIENLVVDLLNNWPKQDKFLLCIVNKSYDEKLFQKITNRNVKVVCLDRPVGGKKWKYLRLLNKEISRFNTQIVHCHSNSIFKFCIPVKIINKNVKLVLHVHDTSIYERISDLDVHLHRFFASKIIAISQSVKKDIINRGVSEYQIVLIYNGVDFSKFNYAKKRSDSKCVMNVARIIPPIKGQDILIRAMNIVKENRGDVHCIFVGAPPKVHRNFLKELKSEVDSYKLNDVVSFLGNRNDVPKLLNRADVFVLPSRYEGFGISIVEAMAAKIPVIATNLEGPKEIIGDNDYGYLFSKNNYQELAQKIIRVLNNDQTELVEKAYSYALLNFSIENMTQKLSDLYNSVLAD